ncbi:unnamed protein product [Polarella glacialis]|uniref:PH domain-containing protein n=1 Tax=Polarella glacialis TaxID=89957 RepID=A0A813H072_POLGL|nr:unnamed protein product [Polarella glacialis]
MVRSSCALHQGVLGVHWGKDVHLLHLTLYEDRLDYYDQASAGAISSRKLLGSISSHDIKDYVFSPGEIELRLPSESVVLIATDDEDFEQWRRAFGNWAVLQAGCPLLDDEVEDESSLPSEALTASSAELLEEMLAMQRWANFHSPLPDCDVELTAKLSGRLLEELMRAYTDQKFQALVRKSISTCGHNPAEFCNRMSDAIFEVQRHILQAWGFFGDGHGKYDLGDIIWGRSGEDLARMPTWLKQKRAQCLALMCGDTSESSLQTKSRNHQ